ncbi:MAG: dTMP kinase [Myxococcales bacterium]|nr:dTMP kinase [Polyangiaceae bacterium]MDW8249820.1 dTMP kinase [Myxococcales bacterium]
MIEGHFIVIEGIDGAGTTTQVQRLCERFQGRGLPVLPTREPTMGPVGSLIRQALTHRLVVPGMHGGRPPSWKTMALLFAADRLDHLEAEILPNLLDGVTVISDRYDLSSLAYQSATAPEEGGEVLAWLQAINRYARRPDLTVILDVPPAVAAQRRRNRVQASELYEGDELQVRLAEAYQSAERLVPGDRVVHVDGSRGIEEVTDAIAREVWRFRGEKG